MLVDGFEDDAPWMRPCAEFPNDNPALHRGSIWRCAAIGQGPSAELPPRIERPSIELPRGEAILREADEAVTPIVPVAEQAVAEEAFDQDAEPANLELVDDLGFDDSIDELLLSLPVPAPASSPVTVAAPPADARVDDRVTDPFAAFVAVMEDVARANGGGDDAAANLHVLFGLARSRDAARASAFTAEVLAWQGILRGESEDFDACGAATLDEWAADVVARVLNQPGRVEGLRRDLRARGIAAFGMVAVAA